MTALSDTCLTLMSHHMHIMVNGALIVLIQSRDNNVGLLLFNGPWRRPILLCCIVQAVSCQKLDRCNVI